MANDEEKGKTGIFYTRDPAGVLVMFRGQKVFRYRSVAEFVEAHIKGMRALEEKQENELADQYKDKY